MRGYLKCEDRGVFQLGPKITTVGREGCDLVVATPGTDQQHAIVEFSDSEDCFVLQDLNTAQGTYVNDCRIQNAAVRLAPNDIIRFGFNGEAYELEVEYDSKLQTWIPVAYPPVRQRTAWNQPITVIEEAPYPHRPLQADSSRGLPTLDNAIATQSTTWTTSQQIPLPHPPNLRQRPASASNVIQRSKTGQERTNGWIGPGPTSRPSAQAIQQNLQEQLVCKEQLILQLQNDVKRLTITEVELTRRENTVRQLKNEIVDLQSKLRDAQIKSTTVVSTDNDLNNKVSQLENAITLKEDEIFSLRERLQELSSNDSENGSISKQEYNEKVIEISRLQSEIERIRKEKNLTNSVLSQIQKDMTAKDTSISRLAREVESLRAENKEKEGQLNAMQSKYQKVTEDRKIVDEQDNKDKELGQLRQKFKDTESQLQDQMTLNNDLRSEIEKTKAALHEEIDKQRKFQLETEQSNSKFADMERAERQTRIDSENLKKKLERFRNRVVQVTFSTPGIRAPTDEISDDTLMETLKKLIDERTDLTKKITEQKEQITSHATSKKVEGESARKIRSSLAETTERLKTKGVLSNNIKNRIESLKAISVIDELKWVKEETINLLQAVSDWQADIESSLEVCGINTKISEDSHAKHIVSLKDTWEAAKVDRERLQIRLNEIEIKHLEEMKKRLEETRTEMADVNKLEIERKEISCREHFEQKYESFIDEQNEKLACMTADNAAKFAEKEIIIEQLKLAISEKDQQISTIKTDAEQLYTKVTALESTKVELMKELDVTKTEKLEEFEKFRVEQNTGEQKLESAIGSYKEQIRQHSLTICQLEEKLKKSLESRKQLQLELQQHKQTVTELRTKAVYRQPVEPPKPKVVIQKQTADFSSLEQLVISLRKENAEYKKQLTDQQQIVVALRRDLASSQAKLSDIKGEFSEEYKREMEKNKSKVTESESELIQLRQQMVQLSKIIDKQASDINDLRGELAKSKSALSKFKTITNDKENEIVQLKDKLAVEKDQINRTKESIEEEGKISQHLSALGAQCRGERHEQTIIRQREALAELRARIKALEQVRPNIPTHDQALQQVVMLQKELAEMRASQPPEATIDTSTLAAQVNRARGIAAPTPQMQAASDLERSAHRETLQSLEASEGTYLTLLRGVASSLELDEIDGLRSMSHLSKEERQRLHNERERACEIVTSRIKVLKERLLRKDELLQGYENDLAKLRSAETIASTKTAQVDSLSKDVRTRTEESEYLRESLHRTRERLEQEKRLNSAIKHKKTFHLEKKDVSQNGWPKHNCAPPDYTGKKEKSKRAVEEKIKRKNYEINTLKSELSSRELDLADTRKRLINLETSLSANSPC